MDKVRNVDISSQLNNMNKVTNYSNNAHSNSDVTQMNATTMNQNSTYEEFDLNTETVDLSDVTNSSSTTQNIGEKFITSVAEGVEKTVSRITESVKEIFEGWALEHPGLIMKIEEAYSEHSEAVANDYENKNLIQKTGAAVGKLVKGVADLTIQSYSTGAVVVETVRSGIGKVGEKVGDGLVWCGGKVFEGTSWVTAQVVGIFSEDTEEKMMHNREISKQAIKDYIARDRVEEGRQHFYENNIIGKFLNRNSWMKYDSKTAKGIQKVSETVGEVGLVVGATALTGGAAGGAIAGGLLSIGGTAEDSYQNNPNSDWKTEAKIALFGGLGALAGAANGKLGVSFIKEASSSIASVGLKETAAQLAKSATSKDFVLKTLKSSFKDVGNYVSTAMMSAEDFGKLMYGEENVKDFALAVTKNFGLNVLEDGFRSALGGFKANPVEKISGDFGNFGSASEQKYADLLNEVSSEYYKKGYTLEEINELTSGRTIDELQDVIANKGNIEFASVRRNHADMVNYAAQILESKGYSLEEINEFTRGRSIDEIVDIINNQDNILSKADLLNNQKIEAAAQMYFEKGYSIDEINGFLKDKTPAQVESLLANKDRIMSKAEMGQMSQLNSTLSDLSNKLRAKGYSESEVNEMVSFITLDEARSYLKNIDSIPHKSRYGQYADLQNFMDSAHNINGDLYSTYVNYNVRPGSLNQIRANLFQRYASSPNVEMFYWQGKKRDLGPVSDLCFLNIGVNQKGFDSFYTPYANSYKIYIPVDEINGQRGAQEILDFMIKNNIASDNKISVKTRADSLVLRVLHQSEARKVIDFINGNPNVVVNAQGIPGAMRFGKVSLAMDGGASYNSTVSNILRGFFDDANKTGIDVNTSNLKNYVSNIRKSVLLNGDLSKFENVLSETITGLINRYKTPGKAIDDAKAMAYSNVLQILDTMEVSFDFNKTIDDYFAICEKNQTIAKQEQYEALFRNLLRYGG